ncbi:putative protein kinase, putative,serine/threonine-protein kinase Nek1 [Trypanosoma grayi]|uniref:putative protein kinase, putative,serine/threonine-protein kinase Nek1 n=1 Tax=Trypanosoma grayi TaxID=71804 RepID=UPI0004F43687|nr:putative protein kinase, putative,serine/threonine-protein kinase Nek1 [Trypanosoma grayi]KEG14973.1 putative protein kinase, putative,serine/threonine-protein kinase Nek1 [Trypanosoma grayi]
MEKYTKVRVLGKGSFGSAILIKRRSDNALLVIKEVFLGKMSKKEREEARHECRVLQQLNHPNIVRYVEHFENRNNLYIVMEYCDGGDLHMKLKHGPMKESTILYYYSQVCLAMEYLHSRHILHRDIKTMNVFLMKNGSVKLGDFGISTVLRNTMGMANTVCGTPYYFSPEICRNKPYNNKSDVWALGVLLYELATGRHPFDGNSMQQLMQRIVKGTFAPLPSHFSSEFRKMVAWCLQKDPARRPSIKQTLALPIMRGSLEQLEENLMLATQCKVRLKDIIDFDVGSDNNKNNNGGDEVSRQKDQNRDHQQPRRQISPSPQTPELSPGKAAAIALAGQQQQQLQLPPPPKYVSPGADAIAGLLAQRPAGNMALLGPKPGAAGAAVDHNRIENYRRYLQQQFQRRAEKDKEAAAAHAVNGGVSPTHALPAESPPVRPASPAASPKYQQQQQMPRHVAPVVDPRNLYNNEQPKRDAAGGGGGGGNGNGVGAVGFDERMKRIDAIMQRYAQNVDPSARDTIHAYMKRKQEEYIQRQKRQQEVANRRAELRKQELAKVIEYQKKIGRGDPMHQQQRQQQELHQPRAVQQKGIASPPKICQNRSPPSPRKQAMPQLPPQQQQQQQQKQHSPAFGRDPRCVPKSSRVADPSPPVRRGSNAHNYNNVPNNQRAPRVARQKGKVVAANSPRILLPPKKAQQQLQQQQPDGARREDAARSPQAAAAAAANVNGNDNQSNVNRKFLFPTPVSGKAGLPTSLKSGCAAEAGVPRPSPSMEKASSPLQQHQQPKPQAMLRIISAPVLAIPAALSRANPDDEDEKDEDNGNGKRHGAVFRAPQHALARRSSAPLRPPGEGAFAHPDDPLKELKIVGGKNIIRPTAAAGFMPQGISKQQQQQPPLGQVRSPTTASTGIRPRSPSPFRSKEDLPAAVDARRRFEQLVRQQVPLSEMKLHMEETPAVKEMTPLSRFPSNVADPTNIKKQRNSVDNNADKASQPHAPAAVAVRNNNPGEEWPRKKELPPPLGLAPLQVRSAQVFPVQCGSPSFLSSPAKALLGGQHAAAGRPGVKQPLQRGSGNTNISAPQQSGIGIMPAVLGVKVPPQTRAPGVGPRRENCAPQNSQAEEPPVLVDIDYGVSSAPCEDATKETNPSLDLHSAPLLPSGTDVGSEQPDVAQQWRDVVDTSATHKINHRVQLARLQTSLSHGMLVLGDDDDVLTGFQKAGEPRTSIPSTLEVLRSLRDDEADEMLAAGGQRPGVLLTLLKQKQQKKQELCPFPGQPCVMPTSLAVPLCVDNPDTPTPDGAPQHDPLSLLASHEETSLSSQDVSHRDAAEEEERAALLALVDGGYDVRVNDDPERSNASINSIDAPPEKSLEGYLEMLDHLKDLLYRRRHREKTATPKLQEQMKQLPLPSPLSPKKDIPDPLDLNSISGAVSNDLPTPVLLMYTKSNGGSGANYQGNKRREASNDTGEGNEHDEENEQRQRHGSLEDEEDYDDSAEEETDDEEKDDDDEDFEDALPLSPVRCATLNDTYCRLLKSTEHLPDVGRVKEDNNGDYGGGVDTTDDRSQGVTRNGTDDIIENDSFLDVGAGEMEGESEGGYTMYP